MLELAPRVHARRRVRGGDLDIARAVAAAAQVYVGDPVGLLVGNQHVGWIWGDDLRTWYAPKKSFSGSILYDTYDEAVKKRSAVGGSWPIMFAKAGFSRANVRWWDLWPAAGTPQAGDYSGTARTARAFTKSTRGGAMFPNCSPSVRFATRMSTLSTGNRYNFVILYDRVISYDACSFSASSQNMTNTTTAARWISAGQRGLKASCWIDVTNGTGSPNLSAVSYTTVGGTSGRLVSTTPTLTKNASLAGAGTSGAQNAFASTLMMYGPYFNLQAASDIGIKQIDSYQWSSAPTGSSCFTLTQPLFLQVLGAQIGLGTDDDLLSGIEAYENLRIYDDACLSFAWWVNTTAGSMDMLWIETGVS